MRHFVIPNNTIQPAGSLMTGLLLTKNPERTKTTKSMTLTRLVQGHGAAQSIDVPHRSGGWNRVKSHWTSAKPKKSTLYPSHTSLSQISASDVPSGALFHIWKVTTLWDTFTRQNTQRIADLDATWDEKITTEIDVFGQFNSITPWLRIAEVTRHWAT